jgi:hypothetical protein
VKLISEMVIPLVGVPVGELILSDHQLTLTYPFS